MKTRHTRGSTLFVVLFFIAVLSVFVGAAFNLTSSTANMSQRSSRMTLAYGVADGAMELVYSRWRSIVQHHTTRNLNAAVFTTGTTGYNILNYDITKVSPNDLQLDPGYLDLVDVAGNIGGLKVTIQTVDSLGTRYGSYDTDGRCTDDPTRLIEAQVDRRAADPTGVYPAVATPDFVFLEKNPVAKAFDATKIIYEVMVQLDVPVRGGTLPIGVKRRFTRAISSAAQAAIFFENRLDVIPGASLQVKGKVHTNSSLYTAIRNRTGLDLKFLEQVTYSGVLNTDPIQNATHQKVQLGYGLDDTQMKDAQYANSPSVIPEMAVGGIDRRYLAPPDTSVATPYYNNNSLRELIERPVRYNDGAGSVSSDDRVNGDYFAYWGKPPGGDENIAKQKAIEDARMYNQASVKVLLKYDSSGRLDRTATKIYKKRGTDKPDGEEITSGSLRDSILDSFANNRVEVADNREQGGDGAGNGLGKTVATTVVDMSKFGPAASSVPGYNGIVYVADVSGENATTGSYNNSTDDFERRPDGSRVKKAVMLTDGAELPQVTVDGQVLGFTFASENAVYVKGDYNTGKNSRDPSIKIPSNIVATSTDPDPTIEKDAEGNPLTVATAGQNRSAGDPLGAYDGYDSTGRYKPVTSAIVADAVAVVSKSFQPSQGFRGLGEVEVYRDASGNPIVRTIDDPDPAYAGTTYNVTIPVARDASGNILPLVVGTDPVSGRPTYAISGYDPMSNYSVPMSRAADSTTVNSAVVSGIYKSTSELSGGGAPNLVRFMENWRQPDSAEFLGDPLAVDFRTITVNGVDRRVATSGGGNIAYNAGGTPSFIGVSADQRFTYNGSLMQSFYSKEFDQFWAPRSTSFYAEGTNSQYSFRQEDYSAPATRDIRFDTGFLSKPPAGFPVTVSYEKGMWERLPSL